MKRLGRYLVTTLTVLSLLICLTLATAIVVQWGRSARGGEIIAHNSIRVAPGREIVINRRAWSTPSTLDLDWQEETDDTSLFVAGGGAVPKEIWMHQRFDGDTGALARPAGAAPDWLVHAGLNWSSGRTPPLSPTRLQQSRFIWIQMRYSFLLGAALVVTGVPVIASWRIVRQRRRRLARLCPACAYDLTGNVSGVCPECGTAVAKLPD